VRVAQLLSHFRAYSMGEVANEEVHGLCIDSRKVQPGDVYVAITGSRQDGHNFVPLAVEKGAIVLVVEDAKVIPEGYSGSVVVVDNSRDALVRLATVWFGDPAAKLFCVGVTGTNGKTTLCYLIEHLCRAFGWSTGVLGTIDHHLNDKVWPASLTTPDPITLQGRLLEFVNCGAQAAAFEVSSHALDQRRADGIPFDVAVFANLTRDHLDYHNTMQAYFEAKCRLFTEVLPSSSKPSKKCVINIDDEWGRKLQQKVPALCWTYGTSSEADFKFQVSDSDLNGSSVKLQTPRGEATFLVPMVGVHNVYNAVAAMAVGLFAGASLETLATAVEQFSGVPGRMQRLPQQQTVSPTVFVDYAHTPDALKRALQSLKGALVASKGAGKLIVVFGCGGDRDQGKRPQMGEIASQFSDQVILTSDNPRSEPPQQIIDEILSGIDLQLRQSMVESHTDRRKAIARALQIARESDVIFNCRKGS
jgi:UDP-N-acetylmuramoyl-L-alanyl-D-glutamate--2,6-diaminopimelate ligase